MNFMIFVNYDIYLKVAASRLLREAAEEEWALSSTGWCSCCFSLVIKLLNGWFYVLSINYFISAEYNMLLDPIFKKNVDSNNEDIILHLRL
jgi:hypothetical protein